MPIRCSALFRIRRLQEGAFWFASVFGGTIVLGMADAELMKTKDEVNVMLYTDYRDINGIRDECHLIYFIRF
jgi:hypothetical protein